jgi:hypothetical protein
MTRAAPSMNAGNCELTHWSATPHCDRISRLNLRILSRHISGREDDGLNYVYQRNDSIAHTKQEEAAKANAETTKKPAKVAVTPSEEAAYALSRPNEAPTKSTPPLNESFRTLR